MKRCSNQQKANVILNGHVQSIPNWATRQTYLWTCIRTERWQKSFDKFTQIIIVTAAYIDTSGQITKFKYFLFCYFNLVVYHLMGSFKPETVLVIFKVVFKPPLICLLKFAKRDRSIAPG
ncbi:hypothetical protein BpHYR1_043847 [Brachionus plicatilis]|uniref:Uncharacterized protein n=1 Tax=Brachionus plicatilis TaxID=10195 RepID=A0A3M7PVK6_BRAPC|nr:hypothetical protein BpHYR1_043847 [Brachionus plicatilis]